MSETSERAALLDDVAGDVTVVVDDGDRARATARASTSSASSSRTAMFASAIVALAGAGALVSLARAPDARLGVPSLGSSTGWLNVRREDASTGVDEPALGVDAAADGASPEDESFDVDAWLGAPRPVYESASFASSETSSSWTLLVRDERELWKIPVNKRGGGYRLGNVVKRRGNGWLRARAAVLDNPDAYKGTLMRAFLETRTEGTRAFAATLAATERDKQTLRRSALGELLPRAVVMPMRLSDKVAFVEKNEKLIVDAALDYRRSKCPETCDRFIVSLSLVWGGDERGEGKFAYKDDEYEESIRVLRSMLEYSKTKFPSDFELVFAVTSDADDAVTLYAYARHLMANPLDSASTIIELAHDVNGLISRDGGESELLSYYDSKLEPKRKDLAGLRRMTDLLHRFERVVDDAQRENERLDPKTFKFAPDWFTILSRQKRWPMDASLDHLETVDDETLSDALRGGARSRAESSPHGNRRPETVVLRHAESIQEVLDDDRHE